MEDLARHWEIVSPEERRRRAFKAAAEYDVQILSEVLIAYQVIEVYGGQIPAHNTVRNYRYGLKALLTYTQNNAVSLIRPPIFFAIKWRIHLETKASGNYGAKGLKHSTVSSRISAARLLFRALAWANVINVYMFESVHASPDLTRPWEKRRPYPQKDIKILISHADIETKLLILLGAHAALRTGEILNLKMEDINLKLRRLVIIDGKGGQGRLVKLTSEVTASLSEYIRVTNREFDSEKLFDFTHGDIILGKIKELCSLTGVEYLAFHSFRHSCATVLAEKKGLEAARDHLGHKNAATTLVYAKWNSSKLQSVIESW